MVSQLNKYSSEIVSSVFQSILVAYLILLLVEQVWNGSVSTYLKLNYLLIVVIVFGVIDLFSEHARKKEDSIIWKDYLFTCLLGLTGFIIIKFKTIDLGWISWAISIISGTLITLISIIVLKER